MSIKASIYHLTHYLYDRAISIGPQLIRLRPAPHSRTKILSYSLEVNPQPHFLNHQQDPYGNWLARYVFPDPVRELKIEVNLTADLTVYNPFDFFIEEAAVEWPFCYQEEFNDDLQIYLHKEESGPLLKEWVNSIDRKPKPTVDFLVEINRRIANEVTYVIRMEPGVQSSEETLSLGQGSCRDSSWLLVQIFRELGLAARFVSGYLIQLKPDVEAIDGPSGTDHDFTDLHAWCEVYLPGAGWVGLDPTSGLLAGESHIPLAATPHYRNAAPLSGATGPTKVDFRYDMQVNRIEEHPRITKPFSESSWQALNRLGYQIDEDLQKNDVRLTMGGEPTFVSIDDFESEEWSTAANGEQKKKLADQLIRRLRDRFAPSGLLHYGQGKWYPGETLPRWTFSLYWRADGHLLWENEALIAGEVSPTELNLNDAELLLRQIAIQLAVDPDFVQPAYEDPAEWLFKEANLPENLNPQNAELDDEDSRRRLAKVFSEGLRNPVGYVLPIQRWQSNDRSPNRWISEKWKTRRGNLFVAPGDSSIGYRLPLAALPYLPPEQFPYIVSPDPFAARQPLPIFSRTLEKSHLNSMSFPEKLSLANDETSELSQESVRTALTVEAREGKLCVFLPPTSSLEDYLELVQAIELSAEETNLPIQLEGYSPPHDSRLNVIRVAPDPGVLEVNIHPASTWSDCLSITQTVYEEARQVRLGAEKFMLDGRHTGTGGGNHIVVGGSTPEDSPFLRRPDLLRSLLLYWQRHPSLSYLFSGLFIGPTSQAPRPDEARHESLYELETALAQIPDPTEGDIPRPWLLDRLLRNLLTDVSGNTHRAEICIDKLYSPDTTTGRLGLVEFRGFEMPPDARMSLAQQLLIRGLLAKFWDNPIKGSFARWGTSLQDRFMLPHYVWQDFLEVLKDLRESGFLFQPEWYEAQVEFRFPFYGEVNYEGVHLELRQALEPWPVLGEMGAIGGTVRYTDSSVERLQVKLAAADPERYLLACNQRKVPLRLTEQKDAAVAGVRFKAWQPPEALHPTLPVQSPLVFDLFDRYSGSIIGGCRYHVAHPGGRNYQSFPVNEYEAQARRLARFEAFGHTAAGYQIQNEIPHPEFPLTLDLRRAPQF